MKLSEIANYLDTKWHGQDVNINGFCHDSRKVKPGDLFVATRGERVDGHQFIDAAIKAGAVAALIEEESACIVPYVKVGDVVKALYDMAYVHLSKLPCQVIAVTGSCGKTTAKTFLASIFSQQAKTLANVSSFNTDIGVPLTVMHLDKSYHYAITELGANHAGEIAHLTHLVRPNVATITNAAPAHLEGFGDLNGVACAKGEIFQGLDDDGIAVINNDDAYANFWKKLVGKHHIITFGVEQVADVMAKDIELNEELMANFTLVLPDASTNVQLQIIGEHNVFNAITAAACAYAKNISIEKIKRGLQAAVAVNRRLVVKQAINGAKLIDDSYNANPSSVLAAAKVLRQSQGEVALVLGDMRELGKDSEQLHQALGEQMNALGVNALFCYGDHSQYTAKGFGANAHYFQDKEELIKALKKYLHKDITVLVKGSLSMRMDQIVAAIVG